MCVWCNDDKPWRKWPLFSFSFNFVIILLFVRLFIQEIDICFVLYLLSSAIDSMCFASNQQRNKKKMEMTPNLCREFIIFFSDLNANRVLNSCYHFDFIFRTNLSWSRMSFNVAQKLVHFEFAKQKREIFQWFWNDKCIPSPKKFCQKND